MQQQDPKQLQRYAWLHSDKLLLVAFMLPVKGCIPGRESSCIIEFTNEGRVYLPCHKQDIKAWDGDDIINARTTNEIGAPVGGVVVKRPEGTYIYNAIVPAETLKKVFAEMSVEPSPQKAVVIIPKEQALPNWRIRIIEPELRQVDFLPASGSHWGGRYGRLGDLSPESSPWWVD